MKIKGISYLDLWQAFVHPRITIDLGQWFGRRCHLRYFLSGALSILLFSGAKPFKQFCKRASWGTFMCRYVKLGPVVQEMSFEDTSYLELWQPLCSVDWKHLCNLGGRHQEEHYCTIEFRPKGSTGNAFKGIFLSGALAALLFSGAKPFKVSWGKSLLYEIWTSGSGGDVV